MNRDELIAHKGEVRAEIARLARQIEQLRASQPRGYASRIAELQVQLDAAMAEETRLRQLIDRAKR